MTVATPTNPALRTGSCSRLATASEFACCRGTWATPLCRYVTAPLLARRSKRSHARCNHPVTGQSSSPTRSAVPSLVRRGQVVSCRRSGLFWGCPGGGGLAVVEGVEAVGELGGGGWAGVGVADVGCQPGDLTGGDEGVQAGPAADVPAVGVGEGVEVGGVGVAQAAAGVVGLGEVPLRWPDCHVVPVAEDDVPVAVAHEVVAVRVAVDQPRRVREGQLRPLAPQLGDPAGEPAPVGAADGVWG